MSNRIVENQTSKIDLLLKTLQTINAVEPIAVSTITTLIGIIKTGRKTGKTDAEIEAEAADSMATALRTKTKAEQQMSNEP